MKELIDQLPHTCNYCGAQAPNDEHTADCPMATVSTRYKSGRAMPEENRIALGHLVNQTAKWLSINK